MYTINSRLMVEHFALQLYTCMNWKILGLLYDTYWQLNFQVEGEYPTPPTHPIWLKSCIYIYIYMYRLTRNSTYICMLESSHTLKITISLVLGIVCVLFLMIFLYYTICISYWPLMSAVCQILCCDVPSTLRAASPRMLVTS